MPTRAAVFAALVVVVAEMLLLVVAEELQHGLEGLVVRQRAVGEAGAVGAPTTTMQRRKNVVL